MTKYTQKTIRNLVKDGAAIEITNYDGCMHDQLLAQDHPECIGCSFGTYGINGLLLKGRASGTLYAITNRASAIYLYY